MSNEMRNQMKDFVNKEINQLLAEKTEYNPNVKFELPTFIRSL